MDYLEKSASVRADIRNFLPSARSVIVMGTVYNTEQGSGMPVQSGIRAQRRDQGRALRARAGLSQGHRGPAARADRVDGRSEPGPVRGGALRRQAPGAGTRLRASRRHRVDRQELVRDQPRAGIVDVPVGHRHEPGARAGRRLRSINAARARCASMPVRPARSSTRASSTRPGAFRISPSKPKRIFPKRCARRLAITPTAATSARTSARGISRRRSARIRCGKGPLVTDDRRRSCGRNQTMSCTR